MTLSFTCPCGKKLRVRPEHAGRAVTCPGCGTKVKAPLEEDAPVVIPVPPEEAKIVLQDWTDPKPVVAASPSEEEEILSLWNMEGLSSAPFTARQVTNFVDHVRCILRSSYFPAQK